ncbi:MAG: glycosyltransferase [Candidatus Omnitrophica bacterium]|nr:glycosyltransferase [Candidatus Omnitrophota bacterium]
MTPKISVVLPAFNGEKYLRECIDSTLNQRLRDFEFVIGDDCSSDTTGQIIKDFTDERIRYFRRERNLGLFKNLNMLVRSARSPLIRILCQDDLLEPGCLEEEVKFFSKHPDIGMTYCKAYIIDRYENNVGECALGDLPEVVGSELSMQCFFYHGCIPGNLSTICVRKECFDKYGLFNENYQMASDYEMWTRICERENLGVIHKHLVKLRSHPKQLSKAYSSGIDFIRETRKIRSKLLPLLPEEIRSHVKRYVTLRQNVLDTHYCLRCLTRGRFKDFLKIASIMGAADFTLGVIFWLLTLNNHIYRPKPVFADHKVSSAG